MKFKKSVYKQNKLKTLMAKRLLEISIFLSFSRLYSMSNIFIFEQQHKLNPKKLWSN